MIVATWNVNGIRARLDFVRHWLRERKPDVVGLQELKVSDEQFPYAELEACGYHCAVHGQKAWNGVAILTREESQVEQTGLPGQEEFGARLISATVGGIRFTTVYVPNGKQVEHDDYPRKLAWLDSLIQFVRSNDATTTDSVLCGDFNVCPTAKDSWNEEQFVDTIFHTTAERDRVRSLLDCGLTDVFRKLRPDSTEFSWWDYRGGAFHRKRGLRIDFLLAGANVMSRVQGVEIDRDFRRKLDGLTPSDHAPVWIALD
jgi:exodeoxyribonuclease-3